MNDNMFHPGRVIEIFNSTDKNIVSTDNTTQIMLEMWDDNMITVALDAHLSKTIKKGDVVLVDYTPGQNGPRLLGVKILRGETAKRTWTQYEQHKGKMKNTPQQSLNQLSKKQNYVG